MEYGDAVRADTGGVNHPALKSSLQDYDKPLLEYEY
jgi:hypothetical protein